MAYQDLHELLQQSSSSRAFFLSLPVEAQVALHRQGSAIRSAADLRLRASSLEKWTRQLNLSGFSD